MVLYKTVFFQYVYYSLPVKKGKSHLGDGEQLNTRKLYFTEWKKYILENQTNTEDITLEIHDDHPLNGGGWMTGRWTPLNRGGRRPIEHQRNTFHRIKEIHVRE